MAKKGYATVNRPLNHVLDDIDIGQLGLPDLQRPFVWNSAKVRDLFDSLMRGFPIGYFMTWDFPDEYDDVRQIGTNKKNYEEPKTVIIDGQQRLTALFSVVYNRDVYDQNYETHKIRISYDPAERKFEVWTGATDKNAKYIADISEVFRHDRDRTLVTFRKEYIKKLNNSRKSKELPEISDEQQGEIEEGIQELLDLLKLEIPTIEINRTMDAKEVADIFVRINSAGQKLGSKDFIMTLISVYDLPMKSRIDKFCAECKIPADHTSYNHLVNAKPVHIVKVAAGLAFKRGRMNYIYKEMSGTLNDKGGLPESELRDESFKKFSTALDKVLNLNNWHNFLGTIKESGYVNKQMIVAQNTVVYNYLLYLIGKYEFNVPVSTLNAIIRRWFFVSAITSYYSQSVETRIEEQLNDLKKLQKPEEFVQYLDNKMNNLMSDDFFNIKLLENFNNSSGNSPYWYGFIASQIILDTKELFGTGSLQSMLESGSSGTKTQYDKHHLFPKEYLTSIGIVTDQERNQFANFTYIRYSSNIDISDNPPSEYVEIRRKSVGDDEYRKMCEEHALPFGWENMQYPDFLIERRKLMTSVVKKAYEKLIKFQY